MTIETQYVALQEFVVGAKERLPKELWHYIIGGTETEATLRRNRIDLDSPVSYTHLTLPTKA